MNKIEKTIKHWRIIRIMFFIDAFFLVGLIGSICMITDIKSNIIIIVTCCILPFLIFFITSVTIHLVLYFKPAGTMTFDTSGITINAKKMKTQVTWNKVEYIWYNSFFVGLLLMLGHFTLNLGIKIHGQEVDISAKDIGEVKLFKKDYIKIISLIPQEIIDKKPDLIDKRFVKILKNKK